MTNICAKTIMIFGDHDFFESWFHDFFESWFYDFFESWFYDFFESWSFEIVISWAHDFLGSWFLEKMFQLWFSIFLNVLLVFNACKSVVNDPTSLTLNSLYHLTHCMLINWFWSWQILGSRSWFCLWFGGIMNHDSEESLFPWE